MSAFPSRLSLTNADCELSFNLPEAAAGACRMELRSRRTDLKLTAVLCEADMLWSPIQRIETVKDLKVTRAEQASATRAVFGFRAEWARFEFDLVIELAGAEFTVTVPWSSVREHRQEFFRLFGVRPLAGLLTATGGDTVLAPVRSGALIRVGRSRPPMKDQFLIYGQQARWEDLPLLPACAQFTEGRHGVAVIAEAGDCDTQYEIEIADDGRVLSGFSCRYRYLWPDPVDPIDRVLRYVLLDAPSANYSGVGRRLNRFARETWRMSTLEEKCARSPEVRYAAQALVMKTFHGMKDLNREYGDGDYHRFQTFAETEAQLRQLKAAGIEKVCVQLVGWNIDGHDGRYPIRFPIDPRLGGEEGFISLLRTGRELGYVVQVHDNYADTVRPDNRGVIRMLWGDPVPRGIWGGGIIYATNPRKLGEERARRDMLRLKELGVAGLYYLDAMSPPLEIDYDPRNGGPRRRHAEGLAWIMEQGRAVFGACGTECAFGHIVRHSDYIADTPLRRVYDGLKSATPVQGLVDEWIPLWHLMFHGMLIHAKNDAPNPAIASLLEAAETGAAPRSDFSGPSPEPGGQMFAIQWDDRLLPAYKAKCDILLGQLGRNQLAFIREHANLGNDCYRTDFSNGCTVQVDYANKRLTVDDQSVTLPSVFDQDIPFRREP
jgi:hypothetical protein